MAKLFGGSIHHALVHAASEYDRKQEERAAKGRGHYNRYALAQYLVRIEQVEADIAAGATPRDALIAAFNDRLLDYFLKAIGEPKHDPKAKFGQVFYRPVALKEAP